MPQIDPTTASATSAATTGQPTVGTLATTGQRFGTFVIDYIVFLIVSSVFGAILGLIGLAPVLTGSGGSLISLLLSLAVGMAYWTLQEMNGGQTIGKRVMGTRAVQASGGTLTASDAALRTICRFIPFEPFSFLFDLGQGRPKGWHDTLSKTKVITTKTSVG